MTLQRLARLAAALALAAQVARAQEAAGGVDVPDAPPPPAPAGEAAVEAPPAEASRTLGGRVVDARTRQALPSASVAVQGTQISSGVDAEGRFTLAGVPLESFVLAVQERGHQPRELRVGPDARSVTVELSESYVEELVGVGGATQVARRNLANAVSTVSAEDLVRAPAATVDGALQGKVAGANIQSNSGAPGGGLQVRLRGVSTISGQSSPLYVLDGVIVSDAAIPSGIHAVLPLSPGPNPAFLPDDPVNRIADLDPNDIENVEVLKGASAAAIYGSKASNGVVIITTKKGRPGSEPRLQLTQRAGAYQLSRELGARAYGSAEEAEAQWPGLGARYWTPAVFDHERELAGRTDLSTETLASLSGAAGAT
ncbi:MAG TPA: TonB-dependent receptor plug domain-containing protein, partial [Myxococcales bacterium]|nr:TonB-dependent receptor plug domain-containing protein [Myxococcales bacterium]